MITRIYTVVLETDRGTESAIESAVATEVVVSEASYSDDYIQIRIAEYRDYDTSISVADIALSSYPDSHFYILPVPRNQCRKWRMMIMTCEEYYGRQFDSLKRLEQVLLDIIHEYPTQGYPNGIEPILYCKSRIKRPESMMQKLEQHGLPTHGESALSNMHDAVGVRIVCSFLDDVYKIAGWLGARSEFEIFETKDYIAYPKPNGYRSLHLVLSFPSSSNQKLMAEIQLRTIAIDFWAALEHQLKYKKNIKHEKTICSELKRCADEIASVDVSMQTLRDLILNNQWS